MQIQNSATLEQRKLLREIEKMEAQLQALPDGRILFHQNGKYYKWRHLTENPVTKEHTVSYIPKSSVELAGRLCLKQHLLQQLEQSRQKLDAINKLLECYAGTEDLPAVCNEDFKKLINPYLQEDPVLKAWAEEPYEKSTEHPEHLVVPTRSGILVRSKTEAQIADSLLEHHVPFHYEQVRHSYGVSVAPDFTMLNPNDHSQIILWEHFGRMDKPGYIKNNLFKFDFYLNQGFVVGKNLIVTFESEGSPLDINYIDYLVTSYFL